ncbi:hypothetical protein Ga0061061_11711 [Chelatococcus sambhunathii]|uniref:Uncharacterized protein n=1 Tax=Chelatococcus sambhunathii TaxID=363953 RepID=A0ABP2A8U8_9HYPH|nr:hypothetical protein [Chelatococcus sambhunathii]CUA90952.1 hypothetical protein Ga0061061_11711 [Chelatococcus sambhunathii]
MLSVYEDLFGPSASGAGVYLMIAVAALLALRAAPAFIRDVLLEVRLSPVIAGGIAFWWLAISGKFVLAFLVVLTGTVISGLLYTPKEGTKPDDHGAPK